MISTICWRITFARQAGIPDRSDNRVQRELLDAAIAAKIALSDADSVTVNVAGWQGEISREQFNELIAPLVKRTLLAVVAR
ncbi:chaperone protein HscA [Escherichia coli]|uniref:Chaperone protein HscA n=1 Tax=Escherichia coli TaxID=562 RepID=A0A376U5Q5_ECOLX|nr:chaperone protein HscA [Escherichia coli]